MKVVEYNEVVERLDTKTCIGLMKEAFIALESGSASQSVRTLNILPQGEIFAFMPAYLGKDDCFGAKIVTQFPQNFGTGYPSHSGYVMVFESKHGEFLGMADANAITQIRTGCVSAVATDLLARREANSLAIIGAGAQGRSHLAAILEIRPQINLIKVYDVIPESAARFKEEMEPKFGIDIQIAESCEAAVKDCDIICTLTPSKEAYLRPEWIKAGAHVNCVGTFSPSTREATSELVAASRLYADQIEAMKKESGEYLIPLEEGLITEDHIVGSIGQVLLGTAPGRTDDNEITLFDALGLAVEDIICARYLCC